jgi:cytochrome c-type biogenesis protein CcmE
MKIKYTYIIIGALIAVSIILAYDAFTSYMNRYYTVSEIVENNTAYINEKIRVLGTIVNGSRGWTEDGFLLFNLTDGRNTIKVIYKGSSPQNFKEGQQVVVIGKLVSPNRLDASEMLVKCPSKYEGGETSLLSNPIFLIAIIIGVSRAYLLHDLHVLEKELNS